MTEHPKRLAQITLVGLLIIGCIAVLLPFIGAVLFAFIVWITTWPAYKKYLLPRLKGHDTLAATASTLFLILIFLVPTLFLAISLASGTENLIGLVRPYIDAGLPENPPTWLLKTPIVGEKIKPYWSNFVHDQAALSNFAKELISPARQFALATGKIFGNGLLQLLFVFFIVFFLYRDGNKLSQMMRSAAENLGGALGLDMLNKVRDTVLGVMMGIVGTAAGQATVALFGFLIAGVPAPLLLAFATFFLSMIPVGPPLIWGGAAAWLYSEGQTGWAIFMTLYGLLVISSIDNFVKPILMARGSGLSILTVALGVFGGVLVFGFIGIFVGPVLLALGQMLFCRWAIPPVEDAPTENAP